MKPFSRTLNITRTCILAVTTLILASSCIPQKNLLLMQHDDLIDSTYANTFDGTEFEDSIYRIQPNDYLYISVTSVDKQITQFIEPVAGVNFINAENQALVGYHVNDNGTVFYPYVGYIKLGGLTIGEARDTVKANVKDIVGLCRVDVILINNYVHVLGEFNKQGTFNMSRNKLSIYEAVALAGGFTEQARIGKVKVLRTERGIRKIYVVDLRSGKLIGKNMFYVFPNDVIYAEPLKTKSLGLTPTFSLSMVTTLVTLALFVKSML